LYGVRGKKDFGIWDGTVFLGFEKIRKMNLNAILGFW
tara:strand:- start:260 stop:370 length:111 start_codon:yes stop_codon:yes gene_type:complete